MFSSLDIQNLLSQVHANNISNTVFEFLKSDMALTLGGAGLVVYIILKIKKWFLKYTLAGGITGAYALNQMDGNFDVDKIQSFMTTVISFIKNLPM